MTCKVYEISNTLSTKPSRPDANRGYIYLLSKWKWFRIQLEFTCYSLPFFIYCVRRGCKRGVLQLKRRFVLISVHKPSLRPISDYSVRCLAFFQYHILFSRGAGGEPCNGFKMVPTRKESGNKKASRNTYLCHFSFNCYGRWMRENVRSTRMEKNVCSRNGRTTRQRIRKAQTG